jgi:CO/xanthine dehydrogenase FAD-binding subunit
MLLPKFDYYEPREMAEAVKLLSQPDGDTKILAGGTDMLVNMKKKTVAPKRLVSIAKLPGLSEIEPKDGGLLIGSHLIIAKLVEFDIVRKKFPSLSKAAGVLGSPLIRNRATIGGNIVTARPAADLPPPLIALGAKVKLESARGVREIPLDEFFLGPGQTVIGQDEILTRIVLAEVPPFTGADYIKLGHRNSLEIAIVAVASQITLDKPDGVIKEAKIILSSVAPKAIHAPLAEKALIGERPTAEVIGRVARIAGTECSPITDIRGGAEYRCAMVEVLTARTLANAAMQAQGN